MADPQDRVKVRLPDGRTGFIPRANFETARSHGATLVEDSPATAAAWATVGGDAQPGVMDRALNATGRFLGAAADAVDPKPILDAITDGHPVEKIGNLGKGVLDAQADQLYKAREAWGQGNHADAIRYGMGYLIPLLGPAANAAGDDLAAGRTAEGLGKTAALGLQIAMPGTMQRKGTVRVPGIIRSGLNAAEQAAIQFADRNNIPTDLATRSGNRAVLTVRRVAQDMLPGAVVVRNAQRLQGEALGVKGGQMAEQVHPLPISPQQAGESVRGGLEAEVLKHNTTAASNYDTLRAFEADPANSRDVPVSIGRTAQGAADLDAFSMSLAGKPFAKLAPTEQSSVLRTAAAAGVDVAEAPIMERVPLPVDLRNAKAELRPVVDRLNRQMPVAQVRASTGMKALQNIMDAADFLPLSVADTDLSAIKAAARGADLPELRTLSQGLAANAVQKMEDAVSSGVAQAGPEAQAARDAGRAATAAKYDTGAVLKQLLQEPVQAFNQLRYPGDSGVTFLRDVSREAPAEMPKVGRAVLQGLLEEAQASGEFQGGKQLLKNWQKLGPETKKILFKNPAMIQDLDNFFRLAEMHSRNPNPSGSAATGASIMHISSTGGMMLANPVGGAAVAIAPYVVAKMLYSPRAARLLMDGVKIPLANRGAALVAFNNIMQIVGKLQKEQQDENQPAAVPAGTRNRR
jgi:propanediol dehydratase small subunit